MLPLVLPCILEKSVCLCYNILMSRSCEEGKYSENRRSYLCLWCGCGTIGAAPDFLSSLGKRKESNFLFLTSCVAIVNCGYFLLAVAQPAPGYDFQRHCLFAGGHHPSHAEDPAAGLSQVHHAPYGSGVWAVEQAIDIDFDSCPYPMLWQK